MEKENRTNEPNESYDAEGLKDEGVDILNSLDRDSDESIDEQKTVSDVLPPMFPEDANSSDDSYKSTPDIINDPEPIVENKIPSIAEIIANSKLVKKPETTNAPKPNVVENLVSDIKGTHNDPSIKSIRTFKTDAEEAIQSQHVSVAHMVVEESKKREETPIEYESEKRHIPWITIIISLILLTSGAGGLYFVYVKKSSTEVVTTPKENLLPSILRSDKQVELPIDSSNDPIGDFINATEKTSAVVDSIVYIYPTSIVSGEKALTVAKDFFVKAKTTMPDRLLRSLSQEFMLGDYVYDGNSPFIILKNTFYQNAYSGMLEWERNMPRDLSSLIPTNLQGQNLQSNFEDSLVRNKDVRVLRTTAGTIALMYVFIDQNTILITTNQKGLEGLIDKMTTARVVQ